MELVPTDEELAGQVQSGNTEAFSVLFSRYEQKMLRYGRRFLFSQEDQEDAVQEVFIRAYQNIQSFNTTLKFSTWLYRLAHNNFINILKKKGREPISFFDFDTFFKLPIKDEHGIEENTITNEDRKMIAEHLDTLPFKYREVLILYYFEELGYKEIADILKIPVSTIGVRISRGKNLLKKKITV